MDHISGGAVNDRLGPKKVIALGGIMFGGGMVISGFATSVSFLIVSYGLIAGLGLGMAYGATISTSVKYFPDKRGLIGGITTAVYGMSSVILPPVVTIIVNRWNATIAFKAVGAVFLYRWRLIIAIYAEHGRFATFTYSCECASPGGLYIWQLLNARYIATPDHPYSRINNYQPFSLAKLLFLRSGISMFHQIL